MTPGCVNEVPEMECGRSEIDELIKEVSGDCISRGLAPSAGAVCVSVGVASFLPCQGVWSPGLSRIVVPPP